MADQDAGTAAEITESVEVAVKLPKSAFEMPPNVVVDPPTIEMAIENEVIPQSIGALALQKVVDEKNAALLRAKLLQQELQKYGWRSYRAWKTSTSTE